MPSITPSVAGSQQPVFDPAKDTASPPGQMNSTPPPGDGLTLDLYGPDTSAPIGHDESEVDADDFDVLDFDGDFADLLADVRQEDRPRVREGSAQIESKPMPSAHAPAPAPLNNELQQKASATLASNPGEFFGFVAKNTNPNSLWFRIKNLAGIIADLFQLKKPTLALHQNCVHCSVAVDETLAQFAEKRSASTPNLYQVTTRKPAAFFALYGKDPDSVPARPNALLEQLRDCIPPGSRACITVPVAGQYLSHAMNFVRMDDRDFIICGQQNKVYDLSLPTDVQHFYERYNVNPDEDQRPLCYLITGEAPSHAPQDQAKVDAAPQPEHIRA
ncbi:MAG: hypothetical protein WC284_01130 [Candidimonas sp.]